MAPAERPVLPVTIDDVRAAAERIAPHVHRTPLATSATLDGELAASVVFKCESFQKTGAYKARGALNAVLQLSAEAADAGVLTHSSGNHGAALAWAAAICGIRCIVVTPEASNPLKLAAVQSYGAQIVLCGPEEREATAAALLAETKATFIHPYDAAEIVAGQGTVALELHEEVPGLDVVVAPIGGGGLLSGTAVVTTAIRPHSAVVGGEPERADDAFRSLATGVRQPAVPHPGTIADGLLRGIGEIPFTILTALGARIVTVSEEEIVAAGVFLVQRLKLVVEPSASVALAALRKLDVAGQKVGVILSGGNTDLAWLS